MRINRPCPRDGWQALVNNFVTADTTFIPRLLCITARDITDVEETTDW